jgi:tetratricopeptide (TPR) repeat protein
VLIEAGHAVARLYEDLEKRLSNSRWLYWVYWLIRLIVQSCEHIYEFSRGWLRTRHYSQLFGGLPAVLLAIPLVYCLVRIPFHSARAKAADYREAAIEAWKNDDIETAKLCYRKIQTLGDGSDLMAYESALLDAGSNRLDEAIEQMEQLAPLGPDSLGFAPAHVWLASHELGKKDKPWDERVKISRQHLEKAMHLDPDNLQARIVLADIDSQLGNVEAAKEWLRPVRNAHPSIELMSARIDLRRGNVPATESTTRGIADRFRQRYEDRERLTFDDFVLWAQAEEMLGDQVAMQRVMRLSLRDRQKDPTEQGRLVDFSLRSYDKLELLGPAYRETQLALLDRASELEPDNEDVLIRLAKLTAANGTIKDNARTRLDAIEKKNPLPAEVLKVLAVIAFQQGDMAEARERLDQVFKLDANSPAIANNLAWLHAHAEPIDLPKALELSNRSVELDPDNYGHRETRGQILVKLRRWQDAIQDLEYAINGLPNDASIHASLATAYGQLGNNELANAHQRQARRE